jgi:hypothetical protein
MKIKKEYIILALFIVGLSVYLFMRKGDRNLYELPVLQEVAKNEISKIEISKGTTSIVLSKKDEKWHIAPRDYPADGNLIDGMLNEFENLTVTTLVSESGDYQRYDLGDDKKITVKAWGGEKLLRDFEVGKPAPSFRHTFVKLAGDDRVFHARNNFRNTVDKSVDDLRDKSVLSFQTADITEIQVAKGTTSLALSRKEVTEEDTQTQTDSSAAAAPPPPKMVWQSADDKKGDEQNINRLLSTISNLRCEKFIDDRKKEDFTESVFSIDLKGIQSHRLSIFAKLKEDDESYPAVSSGSDYPFLLSKHTADRIMKNPEDLLEKPKADEEKSEVEKPEPKQKKQ